MDMHVYTSNVDMSYEFGVHFRGPTLNFKDFKDFKVRILDVSLRIRAVLLFGMSVRFFLKISSHCAVDSPGLATTGEPVAPLGL